MAQSRYLQQNAKTKRGNQFLHFLSLLCWKQQMTKAEGEKECKHPYSFSNFFIIVEKYKAMLDDVRVSSRLQDQHIEGLEAEKKTWNAKEKEFKAREAQLKDTIKKQEQGIIQQKETIKEKDEGIANMTENCEKFKLELERMRSFIKSNNKTLVRTEKIKKLT